MTGNYRSRPWKVSLMSSYHLLHKLECGDVELQPLGKLRAYKLRSPSKLYHLISYSLGLRKNYEDWQALEYARMSGTGAEISLLGTSGVTITSRAAAGLRFQSPPWYLATWKWRRHVPVVKITRIPYLSKSWDLFAKYEKKSYVSTSTISPKCLSTS
jgi:hypothetical protein